MSRTYTLTATTYGGRTTSRNMYMSTMQPWAGGKRAGCWKSGSTEYWGAVSFIFGSGDLATVRGHTIESIKLSVDCSSTFAYSEELIYEQKSTASTTDWTIPNYAHEVTVPRYGAIPIIDVTVLGVPDYGYVIGGYYRTYAYADVTGGTLTVVTAETSKTITYNANGGTNAPEPTVVWGEGSWEGIVTIHNPTRTGYSFNGWNTQANGGGTSYAPADDITLTADIILYAQWTALSSVLDSVTDANITETTTVSWTNYGSFTNKLKFIFGSVDSGEIAVTGSSYTYTLPSTWYAQTPNATSGTATVYLYTYADGILIGTSSQTFTASVKSSVVPSIGSITATGVDLMWNLYLQGHSSVTISVAGCAAGAGASIASYSFQGHELNYSTQTSQASASATSGVFAISGSLLYTATVTDTRGRSASQTVTISVTAYAAPNISYVAGVRCNADGTENPITGTTIKASTNFTWTSVGSNALTSTMSYKKHTDQYYTQAQTGLTSGATYIIAAGLALIDSSYDVQVELTDSLGNSATYTIIVPPVVGISFGLRNDRARFGGPVEKSGLQVDWDADFKQDVNIDGNLTGGGVVKTVNNTAPDANGNVDVAQLSCSAILSSSGWYRVCKTANVSGSILKFYINTVNVAETHEIDFMVSGAVTKFTNESSVCTQVFVDKIRSTYNGADLFIDVHYNISNSNIVKVGFEAYGKASETGVTLSRELSSVADAPSGETVVTTYDFVASTQGYTKISLPSTIANQTNVTLATISVPKGRSAIEAIIQFRAESPINKMLIAVGNAIVTLHDGDYQCVVLIAPLTTETSVYVVGYLYDSSAITMQDSDNYILYRFI